MPKHVNRLLTILEPIIEERLSLMEQYSDSWTEKPVHYTRDHLHILTSHINVQVDFLQWLMDSAQGIERTPRALCTRILVVLFAATHSTSLVSA